MEPPENEGGGVMETWFSTVNCTKVQKLMLSLKEHCAYYQCHLQTGTLGEAVHDCELWGNHHSPPSHVNDVQKPFYRNHLNIIR